MTGLIIIFIPLLIYVIGALSVRRKGLTHPDDFFVAYRKVGDTAFSSSSIAYAFQVSTIYPFLLWGASQFYLIPLVNSVCWGIGIFLFYRSFKYYKQFIGKDITLHGFLGEKYGSSVRIIASYLTIIAFLGFAIAETYFGSKVLLSIVEDKMYFYGIVILSLLFVYGYIAYGGQVSSIRTDQLQLIISYVGVFGLLIYFVYLIITNGLTISPILSVGLFLLAIYTTLIFVFRRLKFINFSGEDTRSNKIINRLLNTLIVIIFIAVAIACFWSFLTAKIHTEPEQKSFFNLEGFGWAGLASLIILPLSFQFVDLSNWQRLLSVKDTGNNNIETNLKKGLLTYAVESPYTWIIFVFFGLLATTSLHSFTFQDLLVDIPKQLINSNNAFQIFLGYTFIVSVLAIMLSTVDSFIMGIIFTYVYDTDKKSREIIETKNIELIKANYGKIVSIPEVRQ